MRAATALPVMRSGRVAWQLVQTLWVGGVWTLHFVLLPALEQFGLAPLLMDDIAAFLRPAVVGIALVCILLQCLLISVVSRRGVWRDLRGQLLLLALGAAAAFFLAGELFNSTYGQLFSYLVLAFAGLVLVLQPRPDEEVVG